MSEYVCEIRHGNIERIGRRVVRCRDCAWAKDSRIVKGLRCCTLNHDADGYMMDVQPDGYCAWAERRDEE